MKVCIDCGCLMPDNHIGDVCECCLDDRGDTIPDGLRERRLVPLEWRPIKGYEGLYEISNTGLVKSLRNGDKILKPGKTTGGYPFVFLSVNGVTQNRMIHRLVAETFLPEAGKNLEVNHIDGNKENNSVTNLEWCTRAHNLKHAVDNGLRYSQCNIIRGVTAITPNKEKIAFKSMKDCCNYFGFSKCWLGNYIRKNGNPCTYKDYSLTVHGRGGVTLS